MSNQLNEEINLNISEILLQGRPLTQVQAGQLMDFVNQCIVHTRFKPITNGVGVKEEVRLGNDSDSGATTSISHWDDREEALTITGEYRPRTGTTPKLTVVVETNNPPLQVYACLDPMARITCLTWDIGANRRFDLLSKLRPREV